MSSLDNHDNHDNHVITNFKLSVRGLFMDEFFGFCIVVAVIYFIINSKKSNTDFSDIINSYTPNTSNRYDNVYEVWVSSQLTPDCQKVLIDIYNYDGKINIQSSYDWLQLSESTYQSYVEHNENWTEEKDNYISSLEKQANVMRHLLSPGSMVVWCDKHKSWACDRRAFKYSSSGHEV